MRGAEIPHLRDIGVRLRHIRAYGALLTPQLFRSSPPLSLVAASFARRRLFRLSQV